MDHHTSSSIDHLVSIRESAPQKVLDIPSRVVGVVPQTIELHDSGNTISALLPTVEATDFCAASGLGGPTIVDSVETLREEVLKCLRAR